MTHPSDETDGVLDVPAEGSAGAGGATGAAAGPHRAADDSEEVYFEGSPMLRGEIGHVMLFGFLGVLCIALGVVAMVYGWGWPWWLLTICFLVAAGLVGFPFLMVRTVRYRITNYRIDYERGLFSRRIDTLELWHVEDLRFHQTLANRILRVGTISVISHDETTPRLDMRGIPRPRPVFDALKQRIIAVKRQRGVIKMDIG